MNLSTALVLLVVIGIVILAIRSIIKGKKNGHSSCGGDCGCCGSHSLCQKPQSFFEEYQKKELHRSFFKNRK